MSVATVAGRVVGLALLLGLFVGTPAYAIVRGDWATLVLWALLMFLIWLANGVAPRNIGGYRDE